MSTIRLIHSISFKPCSSLATADASRPSFLEYANIHKGQSWKIKKEERQLSVLPIYNWLLPKYNYASQQ
jgi:hypothetical protein